MIIPHIRDIFICGILGHYHKWLRTRLKILQKVLDSLYIIPSLTVYKKGKRLKASYFKAFSHFSFCFELCYILSCVIFVVLFL